MLLLVQQDEGSFPHKGVILGAETSAGPCVQTERSPHPAEPTALLDQTRRALPEGGGRATTHATYRAEPPQPQMPHGVSGETFVFCGLLFPSCLPPNVSCAKC